jgi:general secretion pathway protein G
MRHKLPACLPALLLAACANLSEDSREALVESLGGAEVQIVDSREFPGGIVCGRYVPLDKWGQSGGPRPFIYRDGVAKVRPSADDRAVYCSEQPAEVISQRFGIALAGEQRQQILQVVDDLEQIGAALERYYSEQGSYPSTEQGIAALTQRPADASPMRRYPDGGYLPALPVDPWQQPYHYEGPVWAGVKSRYRLWSTGADRANGSAGMATDIQAELVPYLKHAAAR